MRKRPIIRILAIVLAFLLVLLLAGPFLIPVSPLEGTKPVAEMADPDSRFVELDGITVHYKIMGDGEPVFVLLHGFGASLYSWHAVMEPLSRYGTVIAYDRVAFGLTERPIEWDGQNPYSSQASVDLLLDLLDHFNIQKAILIGNSAGGTVSMQLYLQHSERVQSLVLVDPAVYAGGGGPSWLRILGKTPQMEHLGPLFVRSIQKSGLDLIEKAWYDPSKITQATWDGYTKPLQADNWDLALWNFTMASQPSDLSERLSEFTLPVLVITGDTDRIVPTGNSIRLAEELPNAKLVVIPQAGHVPHEEQPGLFMQAVDEFLKNLK